MQSSYWSGRHATIVGDLVDALISQPDKLQCFLGSTASRFDSLWCIHGLRAPALVVGDGSEKHQAVICSSISPRAHPLALMTFSVFLSSSASYLNPLWCIHAAHAIALVMGDGLRKHQAVACLCTSARSSSARRCQKVFVHLSLPIATASLR
jgi:hypothetical protein